MAIIMQESKNEFDKFYEKLHPIYISQGNWYLIIPHILHIEENMAILSLHLH